MAVDNNPPEASESATQWLEGMTTEHPDRVGRYRILQVLGEGGMGVVYEAEQVQPVRRRVALKVIKLGMDTRDVVARFEAERQALAVMDHPSIAKVLDGGVTETGRPYFAMEIVRGVPITDYCDTNRLSTKDRLDLFIPVCQAVQHAHQKGVIHRDLKPSNVLVSEQDGRAIPKIIDFGIAKAMGHSLTDKTLVTQYGQAIGTPAYMSPEQAEMSGLDVDTRTDIYSLGVMLYELLAGCLPTDPQEIGVPALIAQLVMRETDPPTPSARLAGMTVRQEAIARARRTSPAILRKELKGDLDWIVMRAMDKDRALRYETASALALDIDRFLRHETVAARPPTPLYRLTKFAARHRAPLAAGTVLAIAVILGLIGTTAGFVRARSAEARSAQEAETAKGALEFMIRLFQSSDPLKTKGATVTARELLEQGVGRIDSLQGQPFVQGRLLQAMGEVYNNLGDYERSESLLLKALEVRRAEFGGDLGRRQPSVRRLAGEELERSLRQLAWLYISEGRYGDALPLAQDAVTIAALTYEPDDSLIADGLQVLGMVERDLAMYDDAREHLQRALAIREAKLAPDHVDIGWSIFHLAWLDQRTGDFAAARAAYERLLPIQATAFGTDHPYYAGTLNDYAVVLKALNEPDSALSVFQRVLTIREQAFGPGHQVVARVLSNIASTYLELGEPEQARPYVERASSIMESVFGPDHPAIAMYLHNQGVMLGQLGRHRDALQVLDRACAIKERELGPDHPSLASTLLVQGQSLYGVGDLDRAREKLERTARLTEGNEGLDVPDLDAVLALLAQVELDAGDLTDAASVAERAVIAANRRDSSQATAVEAFVVLGDALLALNQVDSALAVVLRGLDVERRRSDPSDAAMARLFWMLGRIRLAQGLRPAADSALDEALALERAVHGDGTTADLYDQAAYWSLRGDLRRSIALLSDAVTNGYDDPRIRYDRRLVPVRAEPEFNGLIGVVRERLQRDLGRAP